MPAAAAPAPARPPIWLPRPFLQRSSGQGASGAVRGMGWWLKSSHFFSEKVVNFFEKFLTFLCPPRPPPPPPDPPIWLPRPFLQRSSGQGASGAVRGMGWWLKSSHFFQKKL